MMRALVDFGERQKDAMPPLGYRRMEAIQWLLEVSADGSSRVTATSIDKPRPSRNRASGIDPLLLADTGTYVLGLAESSSKKERAKESLHAFWGLVAEAEKATQLPTLRGLSKAPSKFPPKGVEQVKPKDVVLVRRRDGGIPFEEPAVQAFWRTYLEREMTAEDQGQCGACGQEARLLRILPTGIKGFPQDVKLTSFNLEAFESYGLEQNLNAPLCFRCGAYASAGLSRLLDGKRHRVTLVRGEGMAQQLAVFWLKDDHVATDDGRPVDVTAAFQLMTTGRLPGADDSDAPTHRATIGHLEGLLKVPWRTRDAALATDAEAFHLAVVSANVSRLVLRGWVHGSIEDLRSRMAAYLEATRMVDGGGEESRSQTVQGIVEAIGAYKVNTERRIWDHDPPPAALVRGLVASVYAGHAAPRALTVRAVRVLRNPATWGVDRLVQALLAAVRLERISSQRTHFGGNRLTPPERLDPANANVPYLCGRLFAVLERAQGVHGNWSQNATIVERSYGAASTRPRLTFPPLIRVATTAHLQRARYLVPAMEDLMGSIQEGGGFPKTLDIEGQADFALGFYQQRAALRAEAKARSDEKKQEKQEAPA